MNLSNFAEEYRKISSGEKQITDLSELAKTGFDSIVEELMNERKAIMTKLADKLGMDLESATDEDIENSDLTPEEKETVRKYKEYRTDTNYGYPK